jgi:hypothetical protein
LEKQKLGRTRGRGIKNINQIYFEKYKYGITLILEEGVNNCLTVD